MGPSCWQEIDIEEWSRIASLKILIECSNCLSQAAVVLSKNSVSGISNDLSFAFIANHAKSLWTLPRSDISHSLVEHVAGVLSSGTFLHVSYSKNIGAQALEVMGKHRKSLSGLRHIMHPLGVIDKLS